MRYMDSLNTPCVQLVHNQRYNQVDSWRKTIHKCIHNVINHANQGISPVHINHLPAPLRTVLSTATFSKTSGVEMELSPVSTEPIITTITYIIRKEQV